MAKSSVIRLPTGGLFELEFTAGVWTNITADVDQAQAAVSIRVGRSSPFSAPQVAEFSVVLRNNAGNYTPRNAASPWWPNIQPRKRIRYSYNPGTQRFRFTGYIKSWQPLMVGALPYMAITATDRLGQLAKVTLQSPLTSEVLFDAPVAVWPLTDGRPDTSAAQQGLDASGTGQPPLAIPPSVQRQEALVFGDAGINATEGSGVRFAPGTASSGQYLQASPTGASFGAFTFECWVNAGTALPAWVVTGGGSILEEILLAVKRQRDQAFNGQIGIRNTGIPFFRVTGGTPTTISGTASIVDGQWHHLAVTRASSGGNCTLYVDGVSQGSSMGSPSVTDLDYVTFGVGDNSTARFQGNAAYIALYDTALSPTRVLAHHDAGFGYAGDTTSARIARYLGIAGLSAGDWNLDTGQATVGGYPQAGKDVLSACQEIAASEGGGAALYVTPDGKVRFVNRRYRDSRTPKLTLNAVDDFDPSTYQPSLDDDVLVNQVTVSRSTDDGSLTSQTYTDATSVTDFGVSTGPGITTYADSDGDALNLAQWVVSGQSSPTLRFPQIAVDLTLAGHDLYDAVGQLVIGDRIRLTNIPPAAYPLPTLDFFLEGMTETAAVDSYQVVFDVTAADNPPRFKWDTSRWGPETGAAVLNALITSSASSLAIKTLTGPTWTTSSGSYPLTIHIDEEDITLNAVPGGGTSPQTYSSITRGVNGTTPAGHAANAVISLGDGWAL